MLQQYASSNENKKPMPEVTDTDILIHCCTSNHGCKTNDSGQLKKLGRMV